MSQVTPKYDLKQFLDVYEPSEDTFLFLDALESDLNFISALKPVNIIEIGSGNGIVIAFLTIILNRKCVSFATDINPSACLATIHTATLNNITIDCLNMNLLNNFNRSCFDIILFNPPYVPTETNEIRCGLSSAWAGGKNGREIIDKFLPKLWHLLNDKGICYMIVIKENNPEEIQMMMVKLGFITTIVMERRILGEHLFVLRFSKVCI